MGTIGRHATATASWHADIAEKFGPNAWVAHLVYDSLAKHGIYDVDFRPTDLNLEGLPGVEPYPQPDDDSDES